MPGLTYDSELGADGVTVFGCDGQNVARSTSFWMTTAKHLRCRQSFLLGWSQSLGSGLLNLVA